MVVHEYPSVRVKDLVIGIYWQNSVDIQYNKGDYI